MKKFLFFLPAALLSLVLAFISCSGSGGGDKTISITDVTLNKTTLILTVGDTELLKATVLPDNATNKTVSWTSSRTDIATVNNGYVRALAAGTAIITVTTKDGNKTDTCYVTVTNAPVVYVTGYDYLNQPDFYLHFAKLWVDGQFQNLPNWTARSEGLSVKVFNDDVYVAGSLINEYGYWSATLWINGEALDLSAGAIDSHARSMYIADNGDVYVVGDAYDYVNFRITMLWKINGKTRTINYYTFGNGYSWSVYVSGGYVYVGGAYMAYSTSTNQGAVVRKLDLNANPPTVQNYYLPDGNFAWSVVVSDIGNIYVAGFVSRRYTYPPVSEVAKFWKIDTQGQIQHFDLSDLNSRAEAVCLSANGDIYVAGEVNIMLARVWKIDEQTDSVQILADLPGGYQATAMSISGNGDLYVAGRDNVGLRLAKYWIINPQTKSIKTYPLQADPSPSNYHIYSIFVK